MLKEKASYCCLKLNNECAHSKATHVQEYKWENKAIVLAAENANLAMYNFIVPLRSYSLPKKSLNPILFLLENEYKPTVLERALYVS